jgi:hypothetical protein
MRTDNQLTFTTYEASLKIKANDPIKIIFENIDWSFVHPLVQSKYSTLPQGADGYDPIALFKAQLLIYPIASWLKRCALMAAYACFVASTILKRQLMVLLPIFVIV